MNMTLFLFVPDNTTYFYTVTHPAQVKEKLQTKLNLHVIQNVIQRSQ